MTPDIGYHQRPWTSRKCAVLLAGQKRDLSSSNLDQGVDWQDDGKLTSMLKFAMSNLQNTHEQVLQVCDSDTQKVVQKMIQSMWIKYEAHEKGVGFITFYPAIFRAYYFYSVQLISGVDEYSNAGFVCVLCFGWWFLWLRCVQQLNGVKWS